MKEKVKHDLETVLETTIFMTTLTVPSSVQSATIVRAVTYTNAMSLDENSYKDMELGFHHQMVGCNSKVFGSGKTNTGSLVVIMADKRNPSTNKKERFVNLGILGERLESCDLWKAHGGHLWDFNFRYTPLTPIVCITPTIVSFINTFCAENELNASCVLNARFCSVKVLPVFIALIELGHFPLL